MANRLVGVTTVPGDKSISHRAVMLSSLAKGSSRIRGFLNGSDCLATLKLIKQLGVSAVEHGATDIEVISDGKWKEPVDVLDCENSGTTIRLMTGLLAGQNFFSVLTGSEQIRRRPMGRVIAPLQQMGARIQGRQNHTLAPVAISTSSIDGVRHELKVASAQIKSCLLLAGLFADGTTTVVESGPTRDHTERMLRAMGVPLLITGSEISVSRHALVPLNIEIPGDISSAAFILVAVSILPGSEVTIQNVGVNPTRDGILEALKQMGADIVIHKLRDMCGEPVADLEVKFAQLQAATFGGGLVVRMIDELPILALAATQAHGVTVIKDAAELKVKETNRIDATVAELRKMGAKIDATDDGFVIEGPTLLRGAELDNHGDHRLAMMGEIAALCATGKTAIRGPDVIKDSFPGFIRVIQHISQDLPKY